MSTKATDLNFYKFHKILAALFYGVSSFAVIFINKGVLNEFGFQHYDFLALAQFSVTTLILSVLICFKRIDVQLINWSVYKEILPISLMFLGNIICGLGGTKSLNLPMFTALRRFSILLTMLAEYFILKVTPSPPIIISVSLMVGGALFAALYDLQFHVTGYILVFMNNIFTASNGVYMKKASLSGKVSKMDILFYSSLSSGILLGMFFICETIYVYYRNNMIDDSNILLRHLNQSSKQSSDGAYWLWFDWLNDLNKRALLNSETAEYTLSPQTISTETINIIASNEQLQSTLYKAFTHKAWYNTKFIFTFFLAAIMGSVLNYSIFLCTVMNSALTTGVIGCLKNVATNYIGMIVFSDYKFNLLNFIGLNVSIAGSLYYTYVTLVQGVKGYGGG